MGRGMINEVFSITLGVVDAYPDQKKFYVPNVTLDIRMPLILKNNSFARKHTFLESTCWVCGGSHQHLDSHRFATMLYAPPALI